MLSSCQGQCTDKKAKVQSTYNENSSVLINKESKNLEQRFLTPKGFERIEVNENSFAYYLRTLPLKEHGSSVKYYNGETKTVEDVYIAVVDQDIDAQDLQQCADAVMRLRAEHLYAQKKYNKIHFNFLSDGKPRYYNEYVKGDHSYSKFRKYMRYIFSYANTASLRDEMMPVEINDMQIGDVFIQKGRPFGHAVIVVDMAENKAGKKIYLLAQSYMPAQETQVIVNPMSTSLSPWYALNNETITTPEWTFQPKDLRRFN